MLLSEFLQSLVAHVAGERRWLLYQFNPLRDEPGRVIRWYRTGIDINNQKQARTGSPA
jgi:PAS domain-containing protein